jgi:hypothetical protein
VQSALPIVVFGAVGLSVVMSVLFLFTKGSNYDHIGMGGFAPEADHSGGGPAPAPDSPAGRERELEVRQMLTARNERLISRGLEPVDVDAEVARLLAPAPASGDAALASEVRQLVVARNERRVRRGLEPLEVEDEVQRTLAELQP